MRVGSHVVRLSFTPERTQRSCISIASMDAQQRKIPPDDGKPVRV